MKSMSREVGEMVARSSSIQDQAREQSAKGSYSSFLFASTGVSSGNTTLGFRGARHRRESLGEIRYCEEPRSRQIVSSETLKERLRRETIEALDREWDRGALPDEYLRGRKNGKSRLGKQTPNSDMEKPVRETSSGIIKSKPKIKERKTIWRISKVEIYSVDKPVAQTTQLTHTAMRLLNSPPTLEGEFVDRSCTEPNSEQEQDIGQDSELNEERIWEAPSDTSMETDPLPPPLSEVGKKADQQRNLKPSFNIATSRPLKQLRLEDRKTMYNLGNSVDAWNISTAQELHRCVCAASSSCGEKYLNRLIRYERGNEIVADPFGNPSLGYLHQQHVDRGKQDLALEFPQTLDCGYSIRSNRAFQSNQNIIQDTSQDNLLVPSYQENTSDQWDNSVRRLSKVREIRREKVTALI